MKFEMWDDDGDELDTHWYDHAIVAASQTWFNADTFIAAYIAQSCLLLLRDPITIVTRLSIMPEDLDTYFASDYDDADKYYMEDDMIIAIHKLAYETLIDLAIPVVDFIHVEVDEINDFYDAVAEAHALGLLWD